MTDDVFEASDGALIIDMDEVEESVYETIPKGTYNAVVEECEYKLSQSSGKPMWSLALTIIDGEFKGRKLYSNMSFSEKALPITKQQLLAFAPDVLSSAFDPEKLAAEGAIVGKQLRIKTKIEKYEGEERSRVASLLAPAGGVGDSFLD